MATGSLAIIQTACAEADEQYGEGWGPTTVPDFCDVPCIKEVMDCQEDPRLSRDTVGVDCTDVPDECHPCVDFAPCLDDQPALNGHVRVNIVSIPGNNQSFVIIKFGSCTAKINHPLCFRTAALRLQNALDAWTTFPASKSWPLSLLCVDPIHAVRSRCASSNEVSLVTAIVLS